MEELINDRQTQRTKQTLASCTTMGTGYTASAFTEDNYSTSDTISSSFSEVQLSFNTSLSLTATSSNNYPISEIYDEFLLEKDFSDEEIELSTNSLSERNYINPNPNLLEMYNSKHGIELRTIVVLKVHRLLRRRRCKGLRWLFISVSTFFGVFFCIWTFLVRRWCCFTLSRFRFGILLNINLWGFRSVDFSWIRLLRVASWVLVQFFIGTRVPGPNLGLSSLFFIRSVLVLEPYTRMMRSTCR
ncbi:hypothetical protein C2G38_2163161 [Gigaspora rosea]|uniref:Uncharacterized protein n=1 Tax=Gigaspora rosea TaxID=44941 RepID=A0A397VYV2_9GLOM|nr:hypothetical protein C2G38_2163161 [Gigaspora rosea]